MLQPLQASVGFLPLGRLIFSLPLWSMAQGGSRRNAWGAAVRCRIWDRKWLLHSQVHSSCVSLSKSEPDKTPAHVGQMFSGLNILVRIDVSGREDCVCVCV